MIQNHQDQRDAYFSSADILTDALARYSIVDKHYRQGTLETKGHVERSIIKVYTSILKYTAEVVNVEWSSIGSKITQAVLPPNATRLGELRSAIEQADKDLSQLMKLVEKNLRDQQALDILAGD